MKPFMMYMVGISGSGKTTIATKVTEKLKSRGMNNLQFIDGDVIRDELQGIFGYTYEERMSNNKTVCVVASYLTRNNFNVILAQVGGYQAMRDQVRNIAGGEYIEVYVKCSTEECERRDVKGYYKKVKAGEMENLNGSNAEFEIPQNSDLILDTERISIDEAVNQVISLLEQRNYI